MVRVLALVLLINGVIFGANINIGFVHLGPTLPSYLPYALKQVRIFNEEADIYLACDKEAYDVFQEKDFFKNNRITCAFTQDLSRTENHKKIFQSYNPFPHFRDRYWAKTVERFYVLEELMIAYNIDDLFHFESDVLIYYDLSEKIEIFRKYYHGITGALRSHDHCAPCFVYIRSKEKLAHYLDFLTQEGIKRPTEEGLDMHVPIDYRKKYGKEFMGFLPLVPYEYTEHYHFITEKYEKAANQEWYYEHAKEFDSIFDAALFGFYTGGVDHRNRGPGFDHGPGTIFPNGLFDVGKFNFIWIKDEKRRTIPYVEFRGNKYRVNNLHVNSKDLDQFISYQERE